MLIKRENFMTSKARDVKNLTRSLPLLTLTAMSLVATPTSAAAAPWQTETVSVSFSRAELAAPQGTQKVYEMLQSKARFFCAKDVSIWATPYADIESCMVQLMDQFIESAEIDSLEAFHLSGDL